jgi:hypothetical protein
MKASWKFSGRENNREICSSPIHVLVVSNLCHTRTCVFIDFFFAKCSVFTSEKFSQWKWLIVYVDVTIAGEGLQLLEHVHWLWSLRKGIHYCATLAVTLGGLGQCGSIWRPAHYVISYDKYGVMRTCSRLASRKIMVNDLISYLRTNVSDRL